MLKNLFYLVVAASIALGIGYADQSTAKTVIPINRTAANDGKQMFMSYCAPCHGADGRGNGPVASSLKKQPANLTVLSRNNGGKYPASHVASILQFGTENAAHGTAAMPIWGSVLGHMGESTTESEMKALRINNLSQYVKSIQAQ